MGVNLPGFKKGDRTDIELPAVQRELIDALHRAGKKIILVNCSGSPIGLEPETLSLDVRLEIVYLYISILLTKFDKVIFKSNTAVNGRFTFAQQIDIRAINNLYPHNTILLFLIPLSSRTIFQGAKVEKRNEIRGKDKKEG